MSCKRTVRLQIILWVASLLGVYGCGVSAKTQLTLEEVSQIKNASHVYVIHYLTPEFNWLFHDSGFPFFLDIINMGS